MVYDLPNRIWILNSSTLKPIFPMPDFHFLNAQVEYQSQKTYARILHCKPNLGFDSEFACLHFIIFNETKKFKLCIVYSEISEQIKPFYSCWLSSNQSRMLFQKTVEGFDCKINDHALRFLRFGSPATEQFHVLPRLSGCFFSSCAKVFNFWEFTRTHAQARTRVRAHTCTHAYTHLAQPRLVWQAQTKGVLK